MAYNLTQCRNTINCNPEQRLKKDHLNMVTRGNMMDMQPLFISHGKQIIRAVFFVVELTRCVLWIFVDANTLLWIAPDQHSRQHLHLFIHSNSRPQNF